MDRDDFMTAATNRSIRCIKAELAFLTDASAMSQEQLQSILAQLPTENGMHAPIPLQTVPAAQMSNLSVSDRNEKQNGFYNPSPNVQSPSPQPPAYPVAPQPPQQAALTHAIALYTYAPTDAGDLALQANDKVAVIEYMNAEWWKGKSERTGQEGIFPRSYVRVDAKDIAPPQPLTNYGNVPIEVSQGQSSAMPVQNGQPSKFDQNGKKFGKKLGNAAIFGAGATIGGNIVNSIF